MSGIPTQEAFAEKIKAFVESYPSAEEFFSMTGFSITRPNPILLLMAFKEGSERLHQAPDESARSSFIEEIRTELGIHPEWALTKTQEAKPLLDFLCSYLCLYPKDKSLSEIAVLLIQHGAEITEDIREKFASNPAVLEELTKEAHVRSRMELLEGIVQGDKKSPEEDKDEVAQLLRDPRVFRCRDKLASSQIIESAAPFL